MQNAATPHGTSPWASTVMHNAHHSQHQQQRNASNPRYPPDTTVQSADDSFNTHGMWMGNTGAAGNYAYGSNVNNMYSLPQPSSSSRRTSGGTKAVTPPASAPAGATASPTYYPSRQDMNSPANYQPTSAPPQVLSHMGQQSQHPYYAGYNYYDQTGQYQQSQPQQQQAQQAQTHQASQSHHYNAPSTFAQQPVQQRQTSTGSVSIPDGRSAPSQAIDYSSQQYHDASRYGQWQANRGQQQAWPGYPSAQSNQPFTTQIPGQYGWQQQQWGQQGYYPSQHASASVLPTQAKQAVPAQQQQAPPPQPQPVAQQPQAQPQQQAPAHSTPVNESKVLGKRAAPAEPTTEDESEKKGSHKKKGKKEPPEPPAPKPPMKSHLHPPRQAPSAWQLFFTDELNKAKAAVANEVERSPGGTEIHPKLNVAQIAKDAGVAYATLNDEQKAYYAKKVEEGKVEYAKKLVEWQATLTPDDIKAENAFRAQQRKEGKSRKGNLKDPNAPKKPLSAYFLFLKSIRENDDLRRSVWSEETETTRQSVLAAERWRGLTDEEKRPYLSQAEKDKQDYETQRKAYEDDAAARARGETVPDRNFVDLQAVVVEPPKSLLTAKAEPDSAPATATKTETDASNPPATGVPDLSDLPFSTPDQHHSSDPTGFDHSMDDFAGFHDPLEEMDLTDLGGMTHDNQWDDLSHLMHDTVEEANGANPTAAKAEPVENKDTSVAPALADATAESKDDAAHKGPAADVAAAAEGSLAVPEAIKAEHDAKPVGAESKTHAGQPTEAAAELPPAGLPAIVDEVPTTVADQVDAEATDKAAPAEVKVEGAAVEVGDATKGL